MPKDFTGVVPPGALTRHPADWFSDILYSCGWQQFEASAGAGNTYFSVAVSNNDTQGRVMRIYGATVISDGGGGVQIGFAPDPIGVQKDVAHPIRPDYPELPQVTSYYQANTFAFPSPTNPFAVPPAFGAISSSGFDSQTTLSPFPLFIVPRDWSIIAWNPGSSIMNGIYFWFLMTPS